MTNSRPPVTEMNEVALEGEVERITFENRETGFRVVKIAVEGRSTRLAVVGTFPSVGVRARVRVRGTISVDRRHGEQLRASSVAELAPTTLTGLEKYLGSGLIKGIGAATATRIVQHFKLGTLRVLDEEAHRLREVPGLGKSRAEAIARVWKEQRAVRDVMVFLQAHEASPQLALRIIKRYGPKAVSIVSSDPYRLAIDIWGVGFRTADRMAASLGIAKDSPQRMQAAMFQTLRDASEAGHCFLVTEDLEERAAQLLEREGELEPSAELRGLLAASLPPMVAAGYVVAERRLDVLAPEDDLERAAVYDAEMFATERRLAHRLVALAQANARPLRGYAQAVARFEKASGTTLADEQRRAVEVAAESPLLIITGGPGVGKTTIVRTILHVFERAGFRTRLAAPTGRAAKRLSESTGQEASTLHRLLEFDPKTATFKRNAARPIEADAIVVDESSMVDVRMMDALTDAVSVGTRLILVGDVDQLPSVGPGSVLRDAIASEAVLFVRLVKIFRQAEQSLIVQNAHKITAGEMPVLAETADANTDFFLVDKRDPDEARHLIVELVARRIPRRFGFDPVRDVQVLAPMNRGPIGTQALNRDLQAALNPVGVGLERGPVVFRVRDKVMQLKNNYDHNVWNGDVGIIASVDPDEGSLVVRYDEASPDAREVTYDGGSLHELALAYACTIHKSQGSEYPVVVLPLMTSHYVMLSKNLLYTGVTRGKRLVVLVADPRALKVALSEGRREERATKLALRMQYASAHSSAGS